MLLMNCLAGMQEFQHEKASQTRCCIFGDLCLDSPVPIYILFTQTAAVTNVISDINRFALGIALLGGRTSVSLTIPSLF